MAFGVTVRCFDCGCSVVTGFFLRVADRMAHLNVAGAWDANPLGTVAAALFLVFVAATVAHLAFKVPMPEVELTPREWYWVRVTLAVLVVVNYAAVVVKTRFPYLLSG